MTTLTNIRLQAASDILAKLRARLAVNVIGQQDVIDQVLIALLAKGHVIIEGVPGLGKTRLVRALADCFAGEFRRVQFTPDLMPADITGHVMFDMKQGEFITREGPVFCHLLLADEINRAPAKTQAALLEVMQERQVTLDGTPRLVPRPFMVLATQNPIEHEGTYPLPEAQLDRFVMKVFIGYPGFEDELAVMRTVGGSGTGDEIISDNAEEPLLTPAGIGELQATAAVIMIDDEVLDYAARLVRATRDEILLLRGAGVRASLALIACARARALLNGSGYVTPDDVRAVTLPVLRHRVALSPEAEIDGLDADRVLSRVIESIPVPRQ